MSCFSSFLERKEAKEKALRRTAEIVRSRNKGLIWSGVITSIILILAVIGVFDMPREELATNLIGVIIGSGILFTFIAQLFWDGAVVDCVLLGGKVIGTPGIIFEFSLDGFIFLIAMKILFAILRLVVFVVTFLFFLFIAYLISPFTFLPALHRVNSGDLVE